MTVSRSSAPVDAPLVGRDPELDRIDQTVRSIAEGTRFLVIRGEAGIGKTRLWAEAVDRHRRAGHRCLVTRCSEEESRGPLVGLAELFGDTDAGAGVLAPDIDRFERGRAVLATLRRLCRESPVVVAIDDVNWLDPVSAPALRSAFRRLDAEPVLVLATERSDASTPPDDRTLPADRRDEIFLGPLPLDATRVVATSVVDVIPRPTVARIHALSGGNPLYAAELARHAHRFGDSLETSLPATLAGALTNRLSAVSDEVLDVVHVVAALGPSSAGLIARAVPGDAPALLARAVESGLLTVGEDLLVRVSHPLLASSALAALDPEQRRMLHGRLAGAVVDPDARARHVALSCVEPDRAAAAELQEAATRAARRGAVAVAADLAWHSVRVTPPDDVEARIRRVFAAIAHRAAAGEKATALIEGDRLVAMLPPGPVRAEAIALRVGIDFDGGDEYLAQALVEAGDDEPLRGRILELRGWLDVVHRAELEKGMDQASEALAIATRLGDVTLEMLAAGTVAAAGLLLGRPRDDLMDRALELARRAETGAGQLLGRGPVSTYGRHCLWCGRLDEARTILVDLHRASVEAGLEFSRPYRILDLAALEIASGNLAAAAELADEGVEAAADAGNAQAVAWLGYPVGIVQSHLGDAPRARDAANLLRARAAQQDGRSRLVMAHHVLGVLALASGAPSVALVALAPALRMMREIGVRLPSVVPVLPDAIEAVALAGDRGLAGQLSAELAELASDLHQPWIDAAAVRGRGMAALVGRADAAGPLADAARRFDELGYRVDAARTLLQLGRALRRSGRRNAAADTLADARRRFAGMGAEPWVMQADAELERVAPGRERAELTPTEARIATMVAAGLRNREIAAQLYVSVATVEAHLTRMYRKLGVRSRTELATVAVQPS